MLVKVAQFKNKTFPADVGKLKFVEEIEELKGTIVIQNHA